jgi:DNA polymerase (family 10)
MRNIAKKLGYKLNEYGIFKGNKNIHVETEEEIFKLIGMKYLEPQERNY